MGIKISECKRWRIEIFFSRGSTNRIGGSRASNFASLGVGWEEQLFHFRFPSIGSRFLLHFLMIDFSCTRM